MADNFAQLVAEAQSLVDTALENEISAYVKSVLREHIVSDIYNVYHPKYLGWIIPAKAPQGSWSSPVGFGTGTHRRATYQRRYSLLQNITGHLTNSGELLVTSTAQKMPPVYRGASYTSYDGDFLRLLEGTPEKPNNGLGAWQGGFGRPAVTKTQQEINRKIKPIIKRALLNYF